MYKIKMYIYTYRRLLFVILCYCSDSAVIKCYHPVTVSHFIKTYNKHRLPRNPQADSIKIAVNIVSPVLAIFSLWEDLSPAYSGTINN